MVAGLILPDILPCLIQKLKADTDVAALVSDRVAMAFPEGRRAWDMKRQSAILVRGVGGPAPSIDTETRYSRVDLNFYGAGEAPSVRRRIARLMWRTVEPVLCPPPNAGLAMGWINATLKIIVRWIRPEMGEPYMAPEPQTDWDRAVMSYMVSWSRLRTS